MNKEYKVKCVSCGKMETVYSTVKPRFEHVCMNCQDLILLPLEMDALITQELVREKELRESEYFASYSFV